MRWRVWVQAWHASAHLAGVGPMGCGGRALLEGGWSHRQALDKVQRYGVVAVRRGQEVGLWVPGYGAEVYTPPVGRGGQGLLQSARAWLRALGVALGALGRYGVWYRIHGEGPYRALDVAGDDGAEVCQPCRAAFAIVYPECVLRCHFGA